VVPELQAAQARHLQIDDHAFGVSVRQAEESSRTRAFRTDASSSTTAIRRFGMRISLTGQEVSPHGSPGENFGCGPIGRLGGPRTYVDMNACSGRSMRASVFRACRLSSGRPGGLLIDCPPPCGFEFLPAFPRPPVRTPWPSLCAPKAIAGADSRALAIEWAR
jgi:hypothetical protein